MTEKNLFSTFSFKILAAFAMAVILTTIIASFLFIFFQKRSYEERLLEQGSSLADLAANNCRIGVFTENSDILADVLKGIGQQKDVKSITVLNDERKVLYFVNDKIIYSEEEALKKITAAVITLIETVGKEKQTIYSKDILGNYTFCAPVLSTSPFVVTDGPFLEERSEKKPVILGYIILDYDFIGGMNVEKNIITYNALYVGIVILIVAIILLGPMVKRLTIPLQRLTNAVENLGKGGIVENIPVAGNDEISRLTNAFNDMNISLQEHENERQRMERQLHQSQKMEAIGLLAGGVAHDFNNLLGAILGNVHLLRGDPNNENVLLEIEAAAKQATSIARNLLTLSCREIKSCKVLELNEIVLDMEPLLQALTPENIFLMISCNEKILHFVGDRSQIEQCILNLCVNARDAMRNGGQLIIRTSCRDGWNDGPVACLEVSDNGVGIDGELIERIFEPFFTTKQDSQGSGLGLSMVYSIVRQYDGIVSVRSSKGIGTTFCIEFPLTEKEEYSARCEAPMVLSGGNETILLVEDNTFARNMSKCMLEKYGYMVIEAQDGEDAIDKYFSHEGHIDLVISDIIMPKQNGEYVYKSIKEMGNRNAKFLFTTGYANIADMDLGDAIILRKPWEPYEFLQKIRDILDRIDNEKTLLRTD